MVALFRPGSQIESHSSAVGMAAFTWLAVPDTMLSDDLRVTAFEMRKARAAATRARRLRTCMAASRSSLCEEAEELDQRIRSAECTSRRELRFFYYCGPSFAESSLLLRVVLPSLIREKSCSLFCFCCTFLFVAALRPAAACFVFPLLGCCARITNSCSLKLQGGNATTCFPSSVNN